MTLEEINGKHVSFQTIDEEDGETEIEIIGIAKVDPKGEIYLLPDDDPVNMYHVSMEELTVIEDEIDTIDVPEGEFEEIDKKTILINDAETEIKEIEVIEEEIKEYEEEEFESFEGEEIEVEEIDSNSSNEEVIEEKPIILSEQQKNQMKWLKEMEDVNFEKDEISEDIEERTITNKEVLTKVGDIEERTIIITLPTEPNLKYTHAEYIAKMILEGGGSLTELFEHMKKQFPTIGDNNIKSAIKNYGKFCVALGIVYEEYIEIEGTHKAIKGFYLKEK